MSERELLRTLFDAAVAAVDPARAMRAALAATPTPAGPVHILAIGKAAVPMTNAAVAVLAERGVSPTGVLAVAPALDAAPRIPFIAGDHPLPGTNSLAAASAIGQAVAMMRATDECWVLLSGGASSLAAAPVGGVSFESLSRLFALLLESGLDIARMNAVRRRFLRWGDGRLAAAIPARQIRVFAISDVPGDAAEDVGSGPCSPNRLGEAEVRRILVSASLFDALPEDIRRSLASPGASTQDSTVTPQDLRFGRVSMELVARNADAVEGAAATARQCGWDVIVGPALEGEARTVGGEIAVELVRLAERSGPRLLVRGGETTVATGRTRGIGGRCQELLLAAAGILEGRAGIALLAAGTDGRDGPTDAAGGIVDGGTWTRARAAGLEPTHALDAHDAYPALNAAGDLLRTGPTGTNVMDLAIGVCAGPRGAAVPPAESPRRSTP